MLVVIIAYRITRDKQIGTITIVNNDGTRLEEGKSHEHDFKLCSGGGVADTVV